MHVYEVRPRKDHRGVDLISDALPFGRLWYAEPDAIAILSREEEFIGGAQTALKSVQTCPLSWRRSCGETGEHLHCFLWTSSLSIPPTLTLGMTQENKFMHMPSVGRNRVPALRTL